MVTKACKIVCHYYYTGLLLFMQAVVAFGRSLRWTKVSVAVVLTHSVVGHG
jgi:hypothetical protein